MAAILKPLSDQQRERQARVARAIASIRLEGLKPTEAANAVFDRHVAGELSTGEMAAEIRALNAQPEGRKILVHGASRGKLASVTQPRNGA